ncbi:MAG: hypothetical protein WCN81_00020 [Actinomycetes bacterium]
MSAIRLPVYSNIKEDNRIGYELAERVRGATCYGRVDHGGDSYLCIGRHLYPLPAMVLSLQASDAILEAIANDPAATRASVRTLDGIAAAYGRGEKPADHVGEKPAEWTAPDFVTPPLSDGSPVHEEPLPQPEAPEPEPQFDMPAEKPAKHVIDDSTVDFLPGYLPTGGLGATSRKVKGWE